MLMHGRQRRLDHRVRADRHACLKMMLSTITSPQAALFVP